LAKYYREITLSMTDECGRNNVEYVVSSKSANDFVNTQIPVAAFSTPPIYFEIIILING